MGAKLSTLLLLIVLSLLEWNNTCGQNSGVEEGLYATPDVSRIRRWDDQRARDDRPSDAYLRTLDGGYNHGAGRGTKWRPKPKGRSPRRTGAGAQGGAAAGRAGRADRAGRIRVAAEREAYHAGGGPGGGGDGGGGLPWRPPAPPRSRSTPR